MPIRLNELRFALARPEFQLVHIVADDSIPPQVLCNAPLLEPTPVVNPCLIDLCELCWRLVLTIKE